MVALKLGSCCFCCSTKTGSVVIASINLVFALISLLGLGIMLILVAIVDRHVDAGGALVIVYVFLGIGFLTSTIFFAFSIVLIRGVVKRLPRHVIAYMIFGSITLFLSILSVAISIYSVGMLVTTILFAVLELYFMVVIYSEYRNIVEEKEQENIEIGHRPKIEPQF